MSRVLNYIRPQVLSEHTCGWSLDSEILRSQLKGNNSTTGWRVGPRIRIISYPFAPNVSRICLTDGLLQQNNTQIYSVTKCPVRRTSILRDFQSNSTKRPSFESRALSRYIHDCPGLSTASRLSLEVKKKEFRVSSFQICYMPTQPTQTLGYHHHRPPMADNGCRLVQPLLKVSRSFMLSL